MKAAAVFWGTAAVILFCKRGHPTTIIERRSSFDNIKSSSLYEK